MHDERFTLGLRQLRERIGNPRAQPLALDDVGGTLGGIEDRFGIVQTDVLAPRVFQVVQAAVAQRLKEPCAEPLAIAALPQVRVRTDERVLNHVCGDVMIQHHRDRMSVEDCLMPMHELAESVDVAGQHAFDNGRVVGGIRIPTAVSGIRRHHDTTITAC